MRRRPSSTHFIINFRNATGCGPFVNGTLVRAAADGAGEIGHTMAEGRGLLCRCGKRG